MKIDDVIKLISAIAPLITLLGIFVSLWISNRTLSESRKDRFLSQKPYLIFESGGWPVPVAYVNAGKSSPGFNPQAIAEAFPEIPPDSISIRFAEKVHTVGHLFNYGNGPAFDIKITWCPKEIWLKDENFKLSNGKLEESKYSEVLNTRVVGKFNLTSGQETGLLHLPIFIEKDYNLQITRVEGYFKIFCKDSLGNPHYTYQSFHLFPRYDKESPVLHITFSDVIFSPDEWEC